LDEYIDGLLKNKAPGVVATTEEPKKEETATLAKESTTTKITETVDETASKNDESSSAVVATDVPSASVKMVTFTMGTQTLNEDFPPGEEAEEDEEADKKEPLEDNEKEEKEEEDNNEKKSGEVSRLLSEDQANETLASEPFSSFFVSASKKVERLLGAPVLADLLDYSSNPTTMLDKDSEEPDNKAKKFIIPSAHVQFECSKWTSTRDCTDIDWSPIHRELMLASYHTPSSNNNNTPSNNTAISSLRPQTDTPSASLLPRSGELQSDGLALVWSLAMPNRPEHIFTCASPVLTTKFHPTEHHLIVGGCQSGQLVVWDIRAGRLPVQRSSLPTIMTELKGHAHPICAMEIVEAGSGLVTASTDGRLNFWSLSNLRDPAESFLIPNGNISSLGVAPESNSIVCGDENGSLHTIFASANSTGSTTTTKAPASTKSSSRRTYRTWNSSEHFGMVTGVSTKSAFKHNNNNNTTRGLSRGFVRGGGGFLLTCGVDWTTKLWAPAYSDEPVLSLLSHSYDYMCDVQWSPVNPSIFATASSNGSLGIWNLATSLDEPLTGSDGIVVDAAEGGGIARGLNKLQWSLDGRRIAVACADKLHVLGLTEDVWKPKGDEESRMMTNLKSRGLLDEE